MAGKQTLPSRPSLSLGQGAIVEAMVAIEASIGALAPERRHQTIFRVFRLAARDHCAFTVRAYVRYGHVSFERRVRNREAFPDSRRAYTLSCMTWKRRVHPWMP